MTGSTETFQANASTCHRLQSVPSKGFFLERHRCPVTSA